MHTRTLSKNGRQGVDSLLTAHGVEDFVWIDPRITLYGFMMIQQRPCRMVST